MKQIMLATALMLLLFSCNINQEKGSEPVMSEQDQRMEWWRDARFGLFIHWGLYAQPAGEWQGEQVPGISEWIMHNAKIPVKEYEQLANTFNPVKYDAEEWVLMAKQAGMKYIVITSKHHDGFAMFHSSASKYNIVDATPFNRDPLKELADACKKHDIRLGFYYSQAQDWHEPGGTYWHIEDGDAHWDKDLVREPLMNYIKGKAVPQVKEILENYGGLDILWWDTPMGMTEEAAQILQDVADQYPAMLTNNRLYRSWPGDFTTPEQHVPPTGLDYDWEVCMTMNTSWGYKRNDHNWKSSQDLVRMLVDIASKGGNLLLNVGPTEEGLFPEPSVERLANIGKWMSVNGESIYGTDASPFFKLPWGRCTCRKMAAGTTLYLHVFNWPEDQKLKVPGVSAKIQNVSLLSEPKQTLPYSFNKGDLSITLPATMPDSVNTVIVVEIKGEPVVTSNMPALNNGEILFPAEFADIHNPGYGSHIVLKGSGKEAVLSNWVDPVAWLEWMFNTTEPGIYSVKARVKAGQANKVSLKIGKQVTQALILSTDGEFTEIDLGEIEIQEPGDIVLSLIPLEENWQGFELSQIRFVKNPLKD